MVVEVDVSAHDRFAVLIALFGFLGFYVLYLGFLLGDVLQMMKEIDIAARTIIAVGHAFQSYFFAFFDDSKNFFVLDFL